MPSMRSFLRFLECLVDVLEGIRMNLGPDGYANGFHKQVLSVLPGV